MSQAEIYPISVQFGYNLAHNGDPGSCWGMKNLIFFPANGFLGGLNGMILKIIPNPAHSVTLWVGCGPSQPLSSPFPWSRDFCCRASLHPRQVWAAWSTLQCRASAEVQQILFLYLGKETGIICVSGLGFWWWHEEAIQDVWPSKCTVMHTSHLFCQ